MAGETNDSLLLRSRDTGRDAIGVLDDGTLGNENHRAAELLGRGWYTSPASWNRGERGGNNIRHPDLH